MYTSDPSILYFLLVTLFICLVRWSDQPGSASLGGLIRYHASVPRPLHVDDTKHINEPSTPYAFQEN